MTAGWLPSDLDDLEAAVADGRLEEDHHNDFKRELHPGQKANRRLAIDLAALAVDGGQLWIGVDGHDNEDVPVEVASVSLAGLPERIESVARSIPEPPIHVTFDTVGGEDGRGVLVVRIPWSSDAPHMVDGRYRGRGEKANEVLSDTEVRDRLLARRSAAAAAADFLKAALEPDPLSASEQARLIIVAQPAVPRNTTMMIDAVDGDLGAWLHGLLQAPRGGWKGGSLIDLWLRRVSPSVVPRVGAVAAAKQPMAPDGASLLQDRGHPEDATDVQVGENGTLRIYIGNVCDAGTTQRLRWDEVVGLVWHTLRVAREIGDAAGYWGPWNVGYGLVGAAGAVAAFNDPFGSQGSPPSLRRDPYLSSLQVGAAQLVDTDGLCARLCGELSRGLGVSARVSEWWPE